MEAVTASIVFDVNVLYFALILSAWLGILALFMPGTGFIELAAVAGLLYGAGGLLYTGGGLLGLVLVVASFVIYAAVILRKFSYASTKNKPVDEVDDPPWLWTIVGAAVQIAGGIAISLNLPGLLWWLVVLLAAVSLFVYRWMLLPTVNALHPPPQAGVESLIGTTAQIRTAPEGNSPGMIYLEGELWQVISDEDLAVGDTVDVIARDGMKLIVQKSVPHKE